MSAISNDDLALWYEQPAEEWRWELPPGFPEPHVPEDNPMTAAKVEPEAARS